MANNEIDFKLWYYTPSIAAAVVFTILFIFLTAYHTWRLVKTRKWFCIPLVIGGLFEIIGYAARAAASSNMKGLTPYIIQSLLLLIAPPLFAATVYMILARIIRATRAEPYSIIPVKWVTTIFVCGDVFCFFIQSGGGGIQAKGDVDTFKLGSNIILGGLILQIVVFCFFLVVAGVYHHRLSQRPTPKSLDVRLPWKRLMWILYSVSVLITLRNLIRVIEYGMGSSGYLLTHEWILYVFDGLLMAAVLAICTFWYGVDLTPDHSTFDSIGMDQHIVQPKERV